METSYSRKKSPWLTTLRTLNSTAVTESKGWFWQQGIPSNYMLRRIEYYGHTPEEIAEMQADLAQVTALLAKYKRIGR
jgi:hypothetical protein